jgi:hypothetical protein
MSFDSKQALGGHLQYGCLGSLPPHIVTCSSVDEETRMEDAKERAAFDIAIIQEAFLKETAALRLEYYVSNEGVQHAKEGFNRVMMLSADAIQAAVRDVEDPSEIITAIVQANDNLMSARQEKKAREKGYT